MKCILAVSRYINHSHPCVSFHSIHSDSILLVFTRFHVPYFQKVIPQAAIINIDLFWFDHMSANERMNLIVCLCISGWTVSLWAAERSNIIYQNVWGLQPVWKSNLYLLWCFSASAVNRCISIYSCPHLSAHLPSIASHRSTPIRMSARYQFKGQ